MTSSIFSLGTISAENGSAVVTGDGTAWAINGVTGGLFSVAGMSIPIASVEGDTSLTLAYAWPGSNLSGASYAISLLGAQAAETIWASRHWARIVGQALLSGIVPVASGTLAERDALDPQPDNGEWFAHAEPPYDLTFWRKVPEGWEGPYQFRGASGAQGPVGSGFVLAGEWDGVATYGKGDLVWHGERSFASFTDGNIANEPPSADEDDEHWQFVPAAVGASGPQGNDGPPGDAGPSGADGVSFIWSGAYSGATAYEKDDVVLDQGSSWIALQATTGNAPPTLPATSNAYWMLMALRGEDGGGSIDGPVSSTDGGLALWDGTGGDKLKDGGVAVQWQSILAATGQVPFPATQNPSADPNTLDDYEEGTFTPAFTFDTPGNLAVTYSLQGGRYTKIGRLVVVEIACATTVGGITHSTASGNLRITGLPFAFGINIGGGGVDIGGITKAGYTQFVFNGPSGQSFARIVAGGSGATRLNVAAADVPSGGQLVVQGFIAYSL